MTKTILKNKTRALHLKHLPMMAALGVFSITCALSAQDIRATVDHNVVNFSDVQPMMINNRVMVPVRGVFEHMNASVVWDVPTRTVIAQHGTDSISLPINSYNATINGNTVRMDTPATISSGRTMVPLRFLSEALGANVEWIASSRTVEINTTNANTMPPITPGYTLASMDIGTVAPFLLNEQLNSNTAEVGDRFTANIDTSGLSNYQELPSGSILQGHIDAVRAKTGTTPGVLSLAFDRVKMADGQTYPIYGSLIGLDSNSVSNVNGRLVAKPSAKKDNLKYVGYGAGGGALLAILTKGNIITNTLIGGALGYLFGEIKKDPSKSRDVALAPGTKFGVRLTREFAFHAPIVVQQPR